MSSARMLAIAAGEIGTREIPGTESNPRIKEYYEAAGLYGTDPGSPGYDDSTTAWCGCFVAWVALHAGHKPVARAASARAWQHWGKSVPVPQAGDVVVLSRGPNPAHGHVGLYLCHTWNSDQILVLGGNQGNSVSASLYDAKRLIAYRRPLD